MYKYIIRIFPDKVLSDEQKRRKQKAEYKRLEKLIDRL